MAACTAADAQRAPALSTFPDFPIPEDPLCSKQSSKEEQKMASSSLTSALTSQSKSPFYPQQLSQLPSSPLFSFARSLKTFRTNAKSLLLHKKNSNSVSLTVKAQTLYFSGSFFEGGGFGSDDDPTSVPPGSVGTATAIEDKEEPQCPPGLRQYETMMVLRPDMSEDERLALTQKYEEVASYYIS